jgi:hypothetical protein
MGDIKLLLHLPVNKPLKGKEKEELIAKLVSVFKAKGISDAKVTDSYYLEKRALPEPLNIVFAVLTATANVATIAMVVRTFLKDRNSKKETNLEIGSMKLTINGDMSDEAIIKLVKESGKIAARGEE